MAIGPHKFVTQVAKELSGPGIISTGTADALAASSDVPELVTFAGYLGGTLQRGNETWRLLYLDTRLQAWLLVQDAHILYTAKVSEDASPGGDRDVIWVSDDAPVGRGSGAQSLQARFLTGEFTRAGDFEAPPAGGTPAAATGVFCEARTPFCCSRRSRY
jgi:hypothetical protein